MAYNRCVGTRYCLNNCPYKVRRFNFLAWNKDVPEVRKLVFNPDVTVRMRGVMEKCTYCVQRIERGKIAANADGRRLLREGEVVSAASRSAPPTRSFSETSTTPKPRVEAEETGPRLRTAWRIEHSPRTTYLARLRNPNPALEPAAEKENP